MGVIAFVRQTPSAALLAAQLIGVLAYPFMERTTAGRPVFAMFGVLVLGLALLVVRSTPFLSWVSVLIAVPAMVLLLLQAVNDSPALFAWSSAFEAVLYFYVGMSMLAYVLQDTHVSRDELFAVGAVFTLLAWAFAYVYVVLQVLDPGAFTADGGHTRTWVELLFLSFTTLSSTGLSDIVPLTGHARSVVMLEQVSGVFYIAMVVTRLVGLQSLTRRS